MFSPHIEFTNKKIAHKEAHINSYCGSWDLRMFEERCAENCRNDGKRVREREGGRISSEREGWWRIEGVRARATKIRAVRHFLREVEPWNY